MQQLNPNKAPGPENISVKFLRVLSTIISPYLSNIFYKCFEYGEYPDALKNAKIIPIHKARQKDVVSSYRPISLISLLSKVFEKLLYIGLTKFFSKNDIITKEQFGFRQAHSTEMAITVLHNMILENKDEGYSSYCVFLDLSKAFDTVNHYLLFSKLCKYSIRGKMYDLYLTNRKQFTECNNTPSETSKLVCRVPQGSALGPLLFSLYINDLPIHTNFHFTVFADDAVLVMKNNNINQLQRDVNQELQVIDVWMKYNRLSLNCTKTNFCACTTKRKSKSVGSFKIIGNHDIQSVEKVKYLGVTFD